VKVPDGLAFSEFRGYDSWQTIAPSQTEDGVKAILGNSVMINAYKAGIPGNGHPGTILDATWTPDPIELISDDSQSGLFSQGDILGPGVGAVPADVSADGRSFSVTWQRNLTPPTG